MERKIKEIVTYEDRTFVIKKMSPFEGIPAHRLQPVAADADSSISALWLC